MTGSSLPHKWDSHTAGNISEIAENCQQLQLLYKTKLQQNPMLCECYFRKAVRLQERSVYAGRGAPQTEQRVGQLRRTSNPRLALSVSENSDCGPTGP